ncbi:MAG: TolC family protein [Firmicutes bacterium]|nr:TolC family protein [Bacillota bacterium]
MPIYHRITRSVAVAMVVIIAAALPVFAEGSGRIELDLAGAIKLAVQNELNLGTVRAGVAEALARIEKAEAAKRPSASVSSSYTRLEEPTIISMSKPPTQDIYTTTFSVQWPLYTGGKAASGLNLARLGADSAQLEYDQAVDDLIYRAVQGYITLLKARSFVQLGEEFVRTTAEHLKFVETNYELGYVTKSDLLETRVRLRQAEQSLLQAQHGAKLAEESLKNLLGLETEAELVLAGLSANGVHVPVPSLAEAIQIALENRPELAQLEIARAVARENLQLAEAYRKPMVVAIGQYDSQGDKFSLDGSWRLTLSAQWQLYDGGAGAAGVAEAQAGLSKIESSLAQAENGIKLEVRQKHLAVSEAAQARELAALTVMQAKESYDFTTAKFELGAATNLEVLTAQSTLNQAQNSLINAEYDYHLAVLDLYKAMSQIENYIAGVDVNA